MDEHRPETPAEEPPVEDEHTFREAFEGKEAGEALTRALAELREIARDLLELSQVKVERARAGMRSGVFTVGIAGWFYVAGIATTIVAAWFLIDGVAGGLGEWLGTAWAGRALAGFVTLAAIGVAVVALRVRERRANLARLKRKFPEDGDDRA